MTTIVATIVATAQLAPAVTDFVSILRSNGMVEHGVVVQITTPEFVQTARGIRVNDGRYTIVSVAKTVSGKVHHYEGSRVRPAALGTEDYNVADLDD